MATTDDRKKSSSESVLTGLEPTRYTLQLTMDSKAGDDGHHMGHSTSKLGETAGLVYVYVGAMNKMGILYISWLLQRQV